MGAFSCGIWGDLAVRVVSKSKRVNAAAAVLGDSDVAYEMEADALMLSVPRSEEIVNGDCMDDDCNPIDYSVEEEEYKAEICSKQEEIVAASDSTITKSCLKCRRVCRGMCVIRGCHRKEPRHGWEDGQFTQRRLCDAMLDELVKLSEPEIEESNGRNKRLTKIEVERIRKKEKEKTTQPSVEQEMSETIKSVLLSLDGSKRRNLDVDTQSDFSVHSFLLRSRDFRSKLHESLLPLHNLRLGALTKKPGTEPEKTLNQKRKGEWLYEYCSEIFSIKEEGSDDDQQEFPVADSYDTYSEIEIGVEDGLNTLVEGCSPRLSTRRSGKEAKAAVDAFSDFGSVMVNGRRRSARHQPPLGSVFVDGKRRSARNM
ncbi:hypothetical protein IV203_025487 [Nitzschia inconspicua]|uniref:Uncharacterized protein n=1 Tax=Nitzschia inconspicua TaxID=303405 RepID=A0A9K3PAJ1_9STRA|nr:hypothetical protein IV203_028267 [Nitzschia inconspicua]KAG7362603.1 hypothetical protein IV203_025487 [Nitzschia inconspicua]